MTEWEFKLIEALAERHHLERTDLTGDEYTRCLRDQWNEMTDTALTVEERLFAIHRLCLVQSESDAIWGNTAHVEDVQNALWALHAQIKGKS